MSTITYTPYSPHVIFIVDFRSALDEKFRDFDVALLHRQVEGGLAILLEGKRRGRDWNSGQTDTISWCEQHKWTAKVDDGLAL